MSQRSSLSLSHAQVLLYSTYNDACEYLYEGHFRLMNSSIQAQWLQQREPRLIHRSVYMINNAIGINYHYSPRSRERSDGLIHVMIHDITYIHVYESTFMFPKGFIALKMTVNIKDFINFESCLNVVCRTWGEVSQQRLWYVHVLCHLRKGGIWVRTHLLVPTGMQDTFHGHCLPLCTIYIYEQGVTKRYREAIKPEVITLKNVRPFVTLTSIYSAFAKAETEWLSVLMFSWWHGCYCSKISSLR